jgi:hypothetical protein
MQIHSVGIDLGKENLSPGSTGSDRPRADSQEVLTEATACFHS